MTTKILKYGELKVNRGMEGLLQLEVTERVNYAGLTSGMKSNLRKALRNGVAPVEKATSGKLYNLYSTLCNYFDMPEAYLSKSSTGLNIRKCHPILAEELNAMHMLTEGNKLSMQKWHDSDTYLVREYRTSITYIALAEAIKRHAPVDEVKLEAALKVVNEGQTIEFKHNTIHV